MNRSHKRRELAKTIHQHKRAIKWESMNQAQAHHRRILDELDAFGVLNRFQRKSTDNLLCFGPKVVTSPLNAIDTWAGIVVWYRPSGYHNYHRLTLLGIWVCGDLAAPQIVMGLRTLRYNEQPYNPESYFYHLQRDFSMYYGNDSGPPDAANIRMTTDYNNARRIEIRQQIASAVNNWERDGI